MIVFPQSRGRPAYVGVEVKRLRRRIVSVRNVSNLKGCSWDAFCSCSSLDKAARLRGSVFAELEVVSLLEW